jgi:hypothetical protein
MKANPGQLEDNLKNVEWLEYVKISTEYFSGRILN